MNRFSPSRIYLLAAPAGLAMTIFSAWCAWRWWPAWIAAGGLLAGTLVAAWLATQPAIEVQPGHLRVGRRRIEWSAIRRVDQSNWISPLVIDLVLVEGAPLRILYPGKAERSRLLLRLIQQRCTRALINGVPHSRIFGEVSRPKVEKAAPAPPRIVSDQDAADIERMFQQLRSARRLDNGDK